MEFRKNDFVTVAIDDIGSEGEGIGKVDGFTLFVKDAVVGDVVEARIVKPKKNYAYARLEKVITPSPFAWSRNVLTTDSAEAVSCSLSLMKSSLHSNRKKFVITSFVSAALPPGTSTNAWTPL